MLTTKMRSTTWYEEPDTHQKVHSFPFTLKRATSWKLSPLPAPPALSFYWSGRRQVFYWRLLTKRLSHVKACKPSCLFYIYLLVLALTFTRGGLSRNHQLSWLQARRPSLDTSTQSFLHRAYPKTRGPESGSRSALIVVVLVCATCETAWEGEGPRSAHLREVLQHGQTSGAFFARAVPERAVARCADRVVVIFIDAVLRVVCTPRPSVPTLLHLEPF